MTPERLLPDKPLNLNALNRAINGALRYRAQAVSTELWPLESLDVRRELERDRLSVSPAKIGIAGDDVDTSLSFDTTEIIPSGAAEFRAKSIDLNQILRTLEVDKDSFGAIGGRGKYWIAGDTVADIAASADGGMFLLMTGGKIDALLTELSGIDDTVFLANGTINLNNEQLDLVLEPHPKDLSLLSAQTSFNINGRMSAPSFSAGSALAERAVAAAMLAATRLHERIP